eukprot:TRINITY_DN1974_c0_g1_i2.p1 TRINITY_DN1974_c0_g1~~TRINITY_DN1974_c0_g1_i2.p1  ORF type:complete len:138 (-),score=25.47 TRINITY_DN1974_c0_g1_i2:5-418(-)
MIDTDSWIELGDTYLDLGDLENAAFCYEEVILAKPVEYVYFVKYAEIRSSMGGQDNLISAKDAYVKAIELNPNHARALYGLCTIIYLLENEKSYKPSEEDQNLYKISFDKLESLYKTKPTHFPYYESLHAMKPSFFP